MKSDEQSSAPDAESEQLNAKDGFLFGKSVYLRPPDVNKDILNGNWHAWFNDADTTKYLTHGIFPVRRENQAAFISEEIKKSTTLLLCIIAKETDRHIGVISLNSIDLINRVAEIRIVMGPNRVSGAPALEAMALLAKHAFGRVNLDMLYAGQHEGLWKWINTLSLVGFRIDGFRNNACVRDRKSYGDFLTSLSASDFYTLESERGGDILGPSMSELLQTRPRRNPAALLQEALENLNAQWRTQR